MTRDIIVIGGSAGSVEVILRMARDLPEDLPASLMVVIHTSPHGNGELAGLIERAGPLKCVLASDGDFIQPGRIYLARPDHHLLIESGKIRVVRGPKENRHRPAIDPLFRSAAVAYGARVIGVILSGALDDGSAGFVDIKKIGGLAIVQSPEDAFFPGMPRNAMNAVDVDYAVPADELPALLSKLCRENVDTHMEASDSTQYEAGVAANRLLSEERMREVASPSIFTCPDCGGDLFEYKDNAPLRFRCSIGHAINGVSLLAAQSDKVEEALATSFRVMVENSRLYRRLMEDYSRRNLHFSAEGMKKKAEELEKHILTIQELLPGLIRGVE
jgi:two-component system chemotaxis response regulator CheB